MKVRRIDVFRKKKKNIELNHGLLAEALIASIINHQVDFCEEAKAYKKDWHYKRIVKMDEHIKFVLSSFQIDDYNYSYFVDTYVDGIKVNQYFFTFYKTNCDSEFWQEWKLSSKEVYHPLPEFIIDKINNFASKTVQNKQKELQLEKKEEEKRRHNRWTDEENTLKGVFDSYDR